MAIALPIVAVLLPATWYLLTRHIVPIRRDIVASLPAPIRHVLVRRRKAAARNAAFVRWRDDLGRNGVSHWRRSLHRCATREPWRRYLARIRCGSRRRGFLTELTSNTATTTTLVPVLAAAAITLGLEPITIIIVTALAASCAFMMPVATPPNAIVFSPRRLSIPEMAQVGFVINILAIGVVALAALVWVPYMIGAGPGR